MSDFYWQCDKLLRVLPSRITMNQSEVARLLNVSDDYARTVIDQLRNDGVAGGFGAGPISRNNRTSTFPDFYKDIIRKEKDYRRTKRYAVWAFWISVTLALWQFVQPLLKALKWIE